ncbi:winged helix-turn-helix transcriptional regulator [Nonomuraea sp. CA-141351]|uniref:winged helix-turn-helix transcriptional regulator n=1 Tax=Nonomuraea sp. CA-141351 TaxID=3239996 RepID=UPI003D89FDF5
MLGRTYEGQNCSAARALELVGERWTLLILRDVLLRHLKTFGEFRASLGIARNVLSARLDHLVREGVLQRRPYGGHADHYEYLPTDKATDLLPVILALTAWGDRWAAPQGPPVLFRHGSCGAAVEQRVECAGCGELADLHQVVAVPGPGR